MARLISCGFELAGSVAAAPTGYEFHTVSADVSALSIQGTTKRSGSYALQVGPLAATTEYSGAIRFASTATAGPIYAKFCLYVDTLPATASTCFALLTGSSVVAASVYVSSVSGQLALGLQNNTPATIGTVTGLSTGRWYCVEILYDTSKGGGSNIIQFRVDESAPIGTAVATQTVTVAYAEMGANISATASSGTWYIDDVAVNDATGTAQNSWVGASGKIVHLWPNGDGDADTACTRSSGATTPTGTDRGANYKQLGADFDKPSPNDATDFLLLTANNSVCWVDCEASSVPGITSSDAINLVQVGGRVAAATAAATNWIPGIKSQSAGTAASGTTTTVNTTPFATHDDTVNSAQYKLTQYVDPQAGGAWTSALLDTMQIGASGTDGNPDMCISALWALVEYVSPVVIAVPAGSGTFTGQAPTVSVAVAGIVIVPDQAAAAIIGQQESLALAFCPPAGSALVRTGQSDPGLYDIYLDIGMAPPQAAKAFTGTATALAQTAVVPAGPTTLAGQQPGLALTVGVAAAAIVTATGQVPTVVHDVIIAPASATLSGLVASLAAAVPVSTAAAQLDGPQPTADVGAGGFVVSPAQAGVVITGTTAVVAHDLVIASAATAITGQTASLDDNLAIQTGTTLVSGQPVVIDGGIPVAQSSATLIGASPALAYVVPVPQGQVISAGQAAALAQTLPILAAALLAQGAALDLSQSISITQAVLAATGTASTNALTMPVGVATASVSGYTPDVVGSGALLVPVADGIWTGYAPSVLYQLGMDVPAAAGVFSGPAPALSLAAPIQEASAAFAGPGVALMAAMPVARAQALISSASPAVDTSIAIPNAVLAATGASPSMDAAIALAAAAASVIGNTPVLLSGIGASIDAAAAACTGLAPDVLVHYVLSPDPAILQIVGRQPSNGGDRLRVIAQAVLQFTGWAPRRGAGDAISVEVLGVPAYDRTIYVPAESRVTTTIERDHTIHVNAEDHIIKVEAE